MDYSDVMSVQDLEIVKLIDRVIAAGAAPQAQLIEGLVYGSLKMEVPSLQRETVAIAVRDYLRAR
jgi:hypothetical protein